MGRAERAPCRTPADLHPCPLPTVVPAPIIPVLPHSVWVEFHVDRHVDHSPPMFTTPRPAPGGGFAAGAKRGFAKVRGPVVARRAPPSALFGWGRKKSPDEASGGRGGAASSGPRKDCKVCKGVGYVDCKTCKGTGYAKGKKEGNIMERGKCMNCQGFIYVPCKSCGGKGLTPEQRGER